MLARLRVSVPDLPGSLGKVASAIGTTGADIVAVDVLEAESGRALDDVFVTVRDRPHADRVAERLVSVPGVRVSGIQLNVPPVTGHTDLELLAQVMDAPERGPRTLVDGAPGALGADWAALVAFEADDAAGAVVAVSPRAPDPAGIALLAPRRLAAVQLAAPGSGRPYGGAVLVPLGSAPAALLLVREPGPPFHRAELWRLEQLGRLLGSALREVSRPDVPAG